MAMLNNQMVDQLVIMSNVGNPIINLPFDPFGNGL
jgi:hypothetical protein